MNKLKDFIALCIIDLLPSFVIKKITLGDSQASVDTGFAAWFSVYNMQKYDFEGQYVILHEGKIAISKGRYCTFVDYKAAKKFLEKFDTSDGKFEIKKCGVSIGLEK